ncbi:MULTISPECIES: hypothetical protein [Protofrankia]|uniref:Concanavalin A-like lectin/glucanases superfamily protein n=1 Tax=Protofrankia coriariae TaxID=1562887 RepID=A0ABR5F4D0_9ACTN|nr:MULTISPECIES: hypothetical protein [Protofrankia]KLL11581.1 hypothetical protein FrCorBMG51_11140 [Protofrankia coriariae]ONH35717.1 hypothetical protein BL254_10535 [Protofrankia sp. BMG5.30]
MAQKQNSFEGQADGVTITAANSGAGSGDAWDVVNLDGSTVEGDTALAAHGLVSARLATGGTAGSPYLSWTSGVSATAVYSRAYIRTGSVPGSNLNLMRFLVGTTIVGTVRLNSSGKLAFLYSSGSLGGTSAADFPLSQWFRVEMDEVVSTTAGSMTVRCYFGNPDDTTATETLSISGVSTGSNGPVDRFRAGIISSAANTELSFDGVAWSDAGPIGPVAGLAAATPAPVVSTAALVRAATW